MLSAEYIDARFHASALHGILTVALGLLVGCALWHTGLALSLKLALAPAVAITLADRWMNHGLRRASASITAIRGTPSRLRVVLANGRALDAAIGDPVVVTRGFVSMTLAAPGRRFHLPVFADAMDEAGFRRLKVFLKLASRSEAE